MAGLAGFWNRFETCQNLPQARWCGGIHGMLEYEMTHCIGCKPKNKTLALTYLPWLGRRFLGWVVLVDGEPRDVPARSWLGRRWLGWAVLGWGLVLALTLPGATVVSDDLLWAFPTFLTASNGATRAWHFADTPANAPDVVLNGITVKGNLGTNDTARGFAFTSAVQTYGIYGYDWQAGADQRDARNNLSRGGLLRTGQPFSINLGGIPGHSYMVEILALQSGSARAFDVLVDGVLVRDEWSQSGGSPYNRVLRISTVCDSNGVDLTFSPGSSPGVVVDPAISALAITETSAAAAPSIQTQPQSAARYVGEYGPASLSVAAGGSWPFFYQWQKNGANLPGMTNAALALSPLPLTLADAGGYQVIVSNAVGAVTSAVAVVTVLPVTAITSGLAGYWNFDEGAGSVLLDGTTNRNQGLLLNFPGDNSQWVAGAVGGALQFNAAASQFVVVTNYPKPAATMSLSAWVWAESNPGWATIAKNWAAGSAEFHFGLFENGGQLDDWIGQTDGGQAHVQDLSVLPLGSWQHVAFVCDGAYLRLYRNGAQVAIAPYNGTLKADPAVPWFGIGGSPTSPAAAQQFWQGKIDDLGFWNRGLTSGEVLAIYLAGVQGQPLTQASYAAPVGQVGINEFMAANSGFLSDSEGNSPDWIEIYNGTDSTVNLEGWSLTDSPAQPTKWRFPATNLAAHAYLVVFASGQNRAVAGQELHTSFKLSASGDYLAMFDPNTNVVSAFAPFFPPQAVNVSFGPSRPATTNEPPGSVAYAALWRYFPQPTPGLPNVGGVGELGPILSSAGHFPAQPLPSENLVVTARVAVALSPVGNVTLHYRAMFGAEVAVPMFDDGAHGDGAAGDGVFGAAIPSGTAGAGQMIRYYLTAADSQGRHSRAPLFLDTTSAQYLGTVVRDLSVTSSLPVLHWFVADTAAADTDAGTPCSLFYNVEFYDNLHVRIRGDTARGWPKKFYKFDFNSGEHFLMAPGLGRVSEINVNSTYTDKSCVRAVLSWESYRNAGTPASLAWNLRLHQNGTFFSVAIFVEQADTAYLQRQGLDSQGALYKATGGVWEKKTRQDETYADLYAFLNGVDPARGAEARRLFLFDNVNLPQVITYLANSVVVQNIDRTVKNFYYYRDTLGSREWRMLPWDVDLTFGPNALNTDTILATNDSAPDHTCHPFFGSQAYYFQSSLWNTLIDAIVTTPATRQMFLRRLRTLVEEDLASRRFEQRLDALAAQLGPDILLDSARWGANAHFPGSTYTLQQAMDRIKNEYLAPRRTHLLTNHLVGSAYPNAAGIPLSQPSNAVVLVQAVEFCPANGNQAQEYICLTNPNPYALDVSGWRVQGAVDFTFAPGTVLPSNSLAYLSPDVAEFRARPAGPSGGQGLFVLGSYQGQLSARGETILLRNPQGRLVTSYAYAGNPSLAQQYLRITEIMYAPAPLAGNTNDAQNFEFIELKNIGPVPLDLTGVRFVNGVIFDFTGSAVASLAPGAQVLVVRSPAAFAARYGLGLPVAGAYTGTLESLGERLVLLDALNEEILDFSYDRAWYPATAGFGLSLVTVNEQAEPEAWNTAANWRPSAVLGGSPGAEDPAPPAIAPILVNELLSASVAPQLDAIELFNPTAGDVDLGGWFITDDPFTPKKFRIPANTIISAGGYRVFTEADFNPGGTGFAFSSGGDEAWLFSGDANSNLTGYSHGFSFGAAEPGITFGRYVISTGQERFVAQSTNTLGAANAPPQVGPVVLRQIMFQPPDLPGGGNNTNEEFIELCNTSTNPVSLFDPAFPLNTWHLRGGMDFDFPTNVTLAPLTNLLLMAFDPADAIRRNAFVSRYGNLAGVPMFGPCSGDLNNSGDTVRLTRPAAPTAQGVAHILVEEVNYGVAAPWPTNAGGVGQILRRRDLAAYADDPANWESFAPLLFLSSPAPVNANLGDNVTLTLVATGAGVLTYQWRLNGTNLPNATNSTLLLSSVTAANTGYYSVRVSDLAASAETQPVLLAVLQRPVFLAQPLSRIATVGSDVSLAVSAEGTLPMGFRWLRNGILFSNSLAPVLRFPAVQTANAGRYAVSITNAALPALPGTSSANAFLTVVLPPANRTIGAGSNVTFSATVSVASGAAAKYQWQFHGTNLPGATASSLGLTNVQPPQGGAYTFWVSNLLNGTNVCPPAGFVASLLVDSDGDGLPDDWELAYGLNPHDPSDALVDSDGDGMSNRDEWIAGTNPRDPLSVLRLNALTVEGGVQVGFQAVSNHTYTAERLGALGATNWLRWLDIPAAPITYWTNLLDSNALWPHFYRVITPGRF